MTKVAERSGLHCTWSTKNGSGAGVPAGVDVGVAAAVGVAVAVEVGVPVGVGVRVLVAVAQFPDVRPRVPLSQIEKTVVQELNEYVKNQCR